MQFQIVNTECRKRGSARRAARPRTRRRSLLLVLRRDVPNSERGRVDWTVRRNLSLLWLAGWRSHHPGRRAISHRLDPRGCVPASAWSGALKPLPKLTSSLKFRICSGLWNRLRGQCRPTIQSLKQLSRFSVAFEPIYFAMCSSYQGNTQSTCADSSTYVVGRQLGTGSPHK